MSAILLLAPSRPAPFGEASTRRLASLAGIDPVDLGSVFALGNLVLDWPDATVTRSSRATLETMIEFPAVILIGRRVADFFGMGAHPNLTWAVGMRADGWMLPTPAAVLPALDNPWWRGAANVGRATEFMRDVLTTAARLRLAAIPETVAYADCAVPA